MSDDPLVIAVSAAIAAYLLYLWLGDYRANVRGEPNPRVLPGAMGAPLWLIILSGLVSIALVAVETWGESALGISDQQSNIKPWFLISMLSAGIVEELLFRGFLVVRNRGRAVLIGSIVGFSVIFALVHGHFVTSSESGYTLDLGRGPLFWTGMLFVNSLWWYTVRFLPANPGRSLLPCFVGHICSNLAVFGIKLAQGHVVLS